MKLSICARVCGAIPSVNIDLCILCALFLLWKSVWMVDVIHAFVRSSKGHCNCTYFMLYIHALSCDDQRGRNRMDTHKKRIEQNIISTGKGRLIKVFSNTHLTYLHLLKILLSWTKLGMSIDGMLEFINTYFDFQTPFLKMLCSYRITVIFPTCLVVYWIKDVEAFLCMSARV